MVMGRGDTRDWTEPQDVRGDRRSLRHRFSLERPINLLAMAASVVAAISVVWAAVTVVLDWVDEATRDEQAETVELLERLGPGRPLSEFEDALGVSSGRDSHPEHGLLETVWARGDYAVRTVADQFEIVQLYSVTSCHRDITPFGLQTAPLGSFEMEPWEWFISGATRSSYMYDVVHGTHPTLYRTEFRGWSTACDGLEADPLHACLPPGFDWMSFRVDSGQPGAGLSAEHRRSIEGCVVPNTYAVLDAQAADLPVLGFCREDLCLGIGPDWYDVQ